MKEKRRAIHEAAHAVVARVLGVAVTYVTMFPTRLDNNAAADPNEVAAAHVSRQAKSSERPGRAKRSGAKQIAAASAKATKASSDRIKSDSKHDKILTLLQRPKGATLDVSPTKVSLTKALLKTTSSSTPDPVAVSV